MTNSMIFACS